MKIITFSLIIFIPISLFSTIINVPTDQPTIQAGIDVAADGDTVLVQPGTYFENINYNGKHITVASLFLTTQDTTYISQTVIDGNENGSVVTFDSGEDSTAVMTGFTISDGSAQFGGGIYCCDSSPRLKNITISDNFATEAGGGVYCYNSSPGLEDIIVTSNISSDCGGGVQFWNSNSIIINITIIDNFAQWYGGGIQCYLSNPTLQNITLSNNHAVDAGGGLNCNQSSPHLSNSNITGNTANYGGGLNCYDNSNPILQDVTISDNSVQFNGGGINCYINSNPSLENVTLSDNSADSYGGGISIEQSAPILFNATITSNTALIGGGISCYDNSSPSIDNATISENSAIVGGGIASINSNSIYLTDVVVSNNEADSLGGAIFCKDNSNLHLENVTVNENTAGVDGGGISLRYANLYIENCDFTGNTSQEYHGGAINCWNFGDPAYSGVNYQVDIANSNFSNNIATNKAGGVGIKQADDDLSILNVMIKNCVFMGNVADSYSSIFLYGSMLSFTVLNCIFSENEAINYAAGGGFSGDCTGEIINCLISSNTAAIGGGNWNSGGFSVWREANVYFVNCSFVDNTAAYGAGLTVGGGGEATITNCIFWGNSFNQIAFAEQNDEGGSLTVNYCDVQYGIDSIYVTPLSNLDWGTGNIDEDPLFIGTGSHPFMLQDLSPCVNAGIPDTTGLNLPEFDLAGNLRVYGGRIDMGAYENQNIIVGTDENLIPLVTKLNQNYPNPFNPETTISFSLFTETTENIELIIYNIKGQKVKDLSPSLCHTEPVEVQGESRYSVIWNGTDDNNKLVSSGIYFYELKSGNYEKTKKMILLK